jgi:hypothetical protein
MKTRPIGRSGIAAAVSLPAPAPPTAVNPPVAETGSQPDVDPVSLPIASLESQRLDHSSRL